MITFLSACVLAQQSVDKAWVRSMQELLELNPAASVQLDLKDTLGRRTVYLDEQGKTLRTDAEFVRIFINPRLHLLVTFKKVYEKYKVFLVDRSGIRFQTEFKTAHQAKWIGDEFFVYGEDLPTTKISQENGAPWHKEEWGNLKTNHFIGGVEPGTYFATVKWPDTKDAETKVVNVAHDGTTLSPNKYDSTRQMLIFCQSGVAKLMFVDTSGDFVVATPGNGAVTKYASHSSYQHAWLTGSESLAYVKKGIGDERCHTHFSIYQPKTGHMDSVASPGKSIHSFVALGASLMLVHCGREYSFCSGGGGQQGGGNNVPKKEPINDEKPTSDLYWFEPKTGKSRKLAEFIPSATVYLDSCRT